MGYLLVVVIAALYLGRGPAILASIAGVLAFDFFFVPPQYAFTVYDTEYLVVFIALLAVGLIISYLTVRAREQAEAAQQRELDTSTLYGLSKDLSAAEGLQEIISAISNNVSQTFGRETVIFLPDAQGNGTLELASNPSNTRLDYNEYAVAVWSFQHGQTAGRGTETLTASTARYIPLQTPRGVVGVLGIKPKDESSHLTPDQRRLLETFATQAALAIERARLADQAQQAQLLQATERLQTALLNSISHDLRTPLVAITGALSSLAEAGSNMDAANRQNLLETALEEADRMNRLVGNLLNMTRLEAGALQVLKQPGDIQDAIGTALDNLGERVDTHKITVHVPEDIPLIPMDFVLIVQVLVNLIDNSLKYSPPQTTISIQVDLQDGEVTIRVSDQGVGIPASDLDRIFDKFYRVQQPENVSGTGLGLSISRGIVEAHGGRIRAENRPAGGATFSFSLPLERIPEVAI
jgi:two-component system sensor histidine kinase KdpD